MINKSLRVGGGTPTLFFVFGCLFITLIKTITLTMKGGEQQL